MNSLFFPVTVEPEQRAELAFFQALKRPPGERTAFLNGECGDDSGLRAVVEALLRDHEKAGSFLSGDAVVSAGLNTEIASHMPEEAGGRIGPYKLLQQIGEGGCGIVWMAEQEHPVRRRVALKVIKLGMDTKQVIARFEAERQALALMDHPNIARVLDAGATDAGRPYFVMELVRGIKITKYCDDNNLTTEARLGLFTQICHAVQHAHQKGIIHRDIKPSNILVTLHDGVPVPKVIDFGIAKATTGQQLTDKTIFTAFEQFIGTPAYMSPEQAEMSGLDIDTRSDIYALGVLLYELLTGQPPFDPKELLASGLDAMRRTIREQEPPRPSTRLSTLLAADLTAVAKHHQSDAAKLAHTLRGDLDWIVMKALEKDRTRRYETANGLALDIQRHLNDEPVTACPPSSIYRFRKMVRRNKMVFAAGSAVIAAILLGLGVSSWMFFKERRARERAVAAEQEQERLRQSAEIQEKKATAEATKNEQVAQFLTDMLRSLASSEALRRDRTALREILDKTAERASKDLKDQPDVGATLRFNLGKVYLELGDYAKSEALHREALAIARMIWGNEHGNVMACLAALSLVGTKIGNFAEAEKMQREALAIARSLYGKEHPVVAVQLTDFATILRLRGKLAEAESVQRESLTINRKLLGSEHVELAASLAGLAAILDDCHRPAEAESLFREALAMQRKLLGNENLKVAYTLGNLALVLKSEGKLAEAESMEREVLAMRRKLLGDEHPEVATCLDNLANTLSDRDKLTEAEPMHREALAMRRKLLGSEHLQVGTSLNNLGKSLHKSGNLAEAEVVHREALALKRKLHGVEHESTATSLSHLGMVMLELGKLEEAEVLLGEALAMRQSLFGKENSLVAASIANLAVALHYQRRYAEAETMHREALAMRRNLEGDEHPSVAESLGYLAWVLHDQGKLTEAATMHREALAMLRKVHGNDHSSVVVFLIRLGVTLRKQDKAAEAESVVREALQTARKLFGDVHPDVARSLHELGRLLKSRGEPSDAAGMFREALEIRRKCSGNEHPDVAEVLHDLGHAIQERGDLEEAEKAFREAIELNRKLFGSEHLKVAEVLNCLGNAILERGDTSEAARLYRDSLEVKRKLLGNEHQDVAAAAAMLALCLLDSGRFAEAEPIARESLAIREKLLPDDWKTFNSRSVLGGTLLGQKEYAKAEPLLLSGYEGMKQREDKIPNAARIRLRQGVERLTRLYTETGKLEKAAEWRKRLADIAKAEGKPEDK